MESSNTTLIKKLRGFARQLRERYRDWRYGIYTHPTIAGSDLGISDPACHSYQPSDYKRFQAVISQIDIRADEDVFIDFGSGLGRAVIMAAAHPFGKVIGVELSTDLHTVAERNLEKMRPRLRCKNVELYNVDGRDYVVPPEVTVVYFWSPFAAEILKAVLENIRRSVQAAPRKVTILYTAMINHNDYLEPLQPALPWLRIDREFPLDDYVSFTLAHIDSHSLEHSE